MNIYGYVRVSSIDQNEDRQILVLRTLEILAGLLINEDIFRYNRELFHFPNLSGLVLVKGRSPHITICHILNLQNKYHSMIKQKKESVHTAEMRTG